MEALPELPAQSSSQARIAHQDCTVYAYPLQYPFQYPTSVRLTLLKKLDLLSAHRHSDL